MENSDTWDRWVGAQSVSEFVNICLDDGVTDPREMVEGYAANTPLSDDGEPMTEAERQAMVAIIERHLAED